MKKSLIFFALLIVISSVAVAMSGPTAPTADVDLELSLSDVLKTKPFWMDFETSFICPPDNGPYTCSYNRDCQRYFMLPPNYVCVNPSGNLCGGHCEPC